MLSFEGKVELINSLLEENELGLMALTDYCEAYIDEMVHKKGKIYFTGFCDGQTFKVDVDSIIEVYSVAEDDEQEFISDKLLATLK